MQYVVVLYRRTPLESETLQSLMRLCDEDGALFQGVRLLIYDNSPEPVEVPWQQFGAGAVEYVQNAANPGVGAAYQYACGRAAAAGADWLLLLDQDTELTGEFVRELTATVERGPAADVAAVVPRLMRDGSLLSPQRVGRFHNLSIANDLQGRSPDVLTALNASACIRVAAFPATDALPSRFPLDYYDHALFFTLQQPGYGVVVLRAALEHKLSVKNLDREMSLSRYSGVLRAEWRFVRATRWGGGTLVHRLRLIKRAAVQFVSLDNKAFAWATLKAVLSRGEG